MPLKTNKCCCGPCPERCVTRGQILDECGVEEVPFYYEVSLLEESCCQISGSLAKRFNECIWEDETLTSMCDDGEPVRWIYDRGLGTLTALRNDNQKLVWRATSDGNPLCTMVFALDPEETDYQCAHIPRTACLLPHGACCDSQNLREEPLPRTLYATVTGNSDAAGFDCQFDPPLSWALEWDPVSSWWVGASPTIGGEQITVKLWCERVVGGGNCTEYRTDVNNNTGTPILCICDPLLIQIMESPSLANCASITISITE